MTAAQQLTAALYRADCRPLEKEAMGLKALTGLASIAPKFLRGAGRVLTKADSAGTAVGSGLKSVGSSISSGATWLKNLLPGASRVKPPVAPAAPRLNPPLASNHRPPPVGTFERFEGQARPKVPVEGRGIPPLPPGAFRRAPVTTAAPTAPAAPATAPTAASTAGATSTAAPLPAAPKRWWRRSAPATPAPKRSFGGKALSLAKGGLMFNGATAGLQAAQLPGQLRGAGDQGAARTIDMIRRLPLMDKFKFLASSDEQFLAHLAKTQPQIAQNYAALMRGDPGLLSTVRASLTGGTLA